MSCADRAAKDGIADITKKVRRGERGFCGRNAACHPDELRL